jgi:GTP-binding protein
MLKDPKYLLTVVDPLLLIPCKAEVAFLGRSNVGKSSLINSVCQRRSLARSSQTPGKTRAINVYEVGKDRWIVDLPGYGFAIDPKKDKHKFGPMIEGYLKGRSSLKLLFLIIDAVAGPTKLDILMYEWLKHYAIPFEIVVNKIDKIRSGEQETRKQEISEKLGLGIADISFVSSRKGAGISSLRKKVLRVLGSGVA